MIIMIWHVLQDYLIEIMRNNEAGETYSTGYS